MSICQKKESRRVDWFEGTTSLRKTGELINQNKHNSNKKV